MRVLVCGSRTWDDEQVIRNILSGLADYDDLVIIEGGALGADCAAARWAQDAGVDLEEYPADWENQGRAAGPIRNKRMLDEGRPHVVWAFSDDLSSSKGTANMVKQATKAGLPVYVVSRILPPVEKERPRPRKGVSSPAIEKAGD